MWYVILATFEHDYGTGSTEFPNDVVVEFLKLVDHIDLIVITRGILVIVSDTQPCILEEVRNHHSGAVLESDVVA